MDINELRALITLLTFLAFVGVCLWAWSSRRKSAFDDTAKQIFSDDEELIHTHSSMEKNGE